MRYTIKDGTLSVSCGYEYGMKYRGFSPGCQPKGVVERRDDPSGKYYDIIVYDRPLTDKELDDYELERI